MSNAIAGRASSAIAHISKDLADLVPAGVSVERFKRLAQTALINTYGIANAKPESVISALQKCASDGLMPDGREAAFVVANGACQYRPMVYGIIKRAGDVAGMTISAHVVKVGDDFFVERGDDEKIVHRVKYTGQERDTIAAYSVFKDAQGAILHREVMERWEIDKARQVAKTQMVWSNWFDEMARKTVIHRGAKYVAMNEQVSQVVRRLEDDADFSRLDEKTTAKRVTHDNIADADAYTEAEKPGLTLKEVREELSFLRGNARMPDGSKRARKRFADIAKENPVLATHLRNWKRLPNFIKRNVEMGEQRREKV